MIRLAPYVLFMWLIVVPSAAAQPPRAHVTAFVEAELVAVDGAAGQRFRRPHHLGETHLRQLAGRISLEEAANRLCTSSTPCERAVLLGAGVPVHVGSRGLAHPNVRTTLGIYAHVIPAQRRDAADRMAQLLAGVGS